jgi:hypothetical protein
MEAPSIPILPELKTQPLSPARSLRRDPRDRRVEYTATGVFRGVADRDRGEDFGDRWKVRIHHGSPREKQSLSCADPGQSEKAYFSDERGRCFSWRPRCFDPVCGKDPAQLLRGLAR